MVMPGIAQADDNNKTVESISSTAQEEVKDVTEFELPLVYTMYAKGQYEIKAEPNEESATLDVSMRNTSFDVIGQTGDWSAILTDGDDAYIKSEYLSETLMPNYTEEELYVLAHVICGEAQGCPDTEQLYVGSVVLNRKNHPSFPNTIKGVAFQKGQYACVRDGNYYREPTERNWANAKWLLENGSILPFNVVWQSGGKQGKGTYVKTKWHYYCY